MSIETQATVLTQEEWGKVLSLYHPASFQGGILNQLHQSNNTPALVERWIYEGESQVSHIRIQFKKEGLPFTMQATWNKKVPRWERKYFIQIVRTQRKQKP